MDAARVCLKFGRTSSCALRKSRIVHFICCAAAYFWGSTAHGLFISQCSNYLGWLRLE
jgi:hypothetical protein